MAEPSRKEVQHALDCSDGKCGHHPRFDCDQCHPNKVLAAAYRTAEAKLNHNRCHSGHETLPLKLWDCPACHDETRRKLAEAQKGCLTEGMKLSLNMIREMLCEVEDYCNRRDGKPFYYLMEKSRITLEGFNMAFGGILPERGKS